jgi:dTDP-4-dehydrorhamnose 3,5-epimerase
MRPTVPIDGVTIRSLSPQRDGRGELVELCRHVWVEPDVPVQWNLVVNRARVVRGIHWHELHTDYIAPVFGSVVAALVDLRPGSPSELESQLVELDAGAPELLTIPAGVGHGFYSEGESGVLYAVTRYWDPSDEFGVRWDDPALGIAWPEGAAEATVSERDRDMPPLAAAPPRAAWRGQPSAARRSAIA